MSAVRFEDPPSGPEMDRASYDWTAIAAALKKRPLRWAIIATCTNSNLSAVMARYVRTSTYTPLREAGKFEAVARTVDGEHRVYARWVGES